LLYLLKWQVSLKVTGKMAGKVFCKKIFVKIFGQDLVFRENNE